MIQWSVMAEKKHNLLVKIFQKYTDEESELETYQAIGILLLVFVAAGCIGWVWEFIVKFVAGGFNGFYVTGGNLLPWINMYAYGAIIILCMAHKLKRSKAVIFGVSTIAMGVFELVGGWLIYVIGNGTRYWDYTNEWYGIGHINGFVCPVSAMAFGLGALALVYGLMPFLVKLASKFSRKTFLTLAVSLFVMIVTDEVVNLGLRWSGLPSAMDFYSSIGFKYS